MLSITITLFTVGFILSIWYQNYILFFSLLILGVVIIIAIRFANKIYKQTIKTKVTKKFEKNFINVNKVPWQIMEEIPHITRVEAKKAGFIRRHFGKFLSGEDFVEKMNIKEEHRQDVLDVICV